LVRRLVGGVNYVSELAAVGMGYVLGLLLGWCSFFLGNLGKSWEFLGLNVGCDDFSVDGLLVSSGPRRTL